MNDLKDDSFAGYLLDQLAGLGGLSCRAMFGGFGLSAGNKFFGIIFKGRLYFKVSAATKIHYTRRKMKPFRPNARQTLSSFYEVPATVIEDRVALCEWAGARSTPRPPGEVRPAMTTQLSKPFLTAEWRQLAMLNFPVERDLLEPSVPAGTALDTYQGQAYVSVVGFRFLKTRLLGWAVPFYQNFEELNLRFYVRRFSGEEWRRGVVFIKEIVPRRAIAMVARTFYNENYVSLPMRCQWEPATNHSDNSLVYGWKFGGRWHHLRVCGAGEEKPATPGSLAEFITEHYWGYAAQKDGGCLEYRVEHPPWLIRRAGAAELNCDAAGLDGERFAAALATSPASAFLAEGSAVTVYRGMRIA